MKLHQASWELYAVTRAGRSSRCNTSLSACSVKSAMRTQSYVRVDATFAQVDDLAI
jgi:hypothetical protein